MAPTRAQNNTTQALMATRLIDGIKVCAAHKKNEARQSVAVRGSAREEPAQPKRQLRLGCGA
eukprot:4276789-Pyramimonas_sp.AAC.1